MRSSTASWRVAILLSLAVFSCAAAKLPESAAVRRVIDGDTIELTSGALVRYIGIDAPEVRRREGGRWRMDPDPYGLEAMDANRRLVEGKIVRLEYDLEKRDRYGRLLAYVSVDGQMVNAALLEAGDAQLLTVPPNVRHLDEFRQLAAQARQAKRGLWAQDERSHKRRHH